MEQVLSKNLWYYEHKVELSLVVRIDDKWLSIWVVLWCESWTNQSMNLCMCNHISRLLVWAKVKIMRVRADGSGATRDEH
jgi:hypothetical protein